MPTAARPPRPRPRRRHAEEQVLDPVAVADFVREGEEAKQQPAINKDFDPLALENDGGLPFMDAIAMITDSEWQNYWLYLYRLEPQVRNADTDSKFIGRYQNCMMEDDIQAIHGGGKFMFLLKENVAKEVVRQRGYGARERRWKFSIDGIPRILPNQTVVGSRTPAAAEGVSTRDESEGAALAKSLPELLRIAGAGNKNGEAGMAQVLEMVTQANKAALTIVTESTKQSVLSMTGSTLGDKLLEKLLLRDGEVAEPKRSKVEDQLINIALKRLENPEPAGGDGGLGQLSAMKELFGVDSIFDLVKGNMGGGDNSWKAKLVDMGASLVANIPQLFQAYLKMQEFQLMRANMAARNPQVIPGQPGAIAPIAGSPQMPPAPAPGPETAFQPAGVVPMDPTAMALEDIMVCFDAGLGGDAGAAVLQRKYPQFVAMFVPLLQNRDQVMLFAKNTPPLSEIAAEEGFPEFMDQFIQEMLHPAEVEEETTGDQPA